MARNLILQFVDVVIVHVPRASNDRADILSKLASTKKPGQHRTLIQEVLNTPSWDQESTFEIQPGVTSWMTPILDFLVNDVLPASNSEARKIRRQAASFTIINGEIFKRRFSSPLLKCLDRAQANYVLVELHRDIYGMH